jgi:hypothetical protein
MKTFACLFALSLSSVALADTVTKLRPPGPVSGAYRWRCAATGFSSPRRIVGACQERHYSPLKYRPPVVVGTWLTSWDFSGNPTRTNIKAAWPGCFGTRSVVMVDRVPEYFITANAQGDELVENYCVSFLVRP